MDLFSVRKNLNLILFTIFGKQIMLEMAKYWEYNLAIWSHWCDVAEAMCMVFHVRQLL